MNETIKHLLEMQKIDAEIVKVRRDLKRYEDARRTRLAEMERAKTKLDEAQVGLDAIEKQVRETERHVTIWRDSLGKFTAQQSTVKTQKEYDAINHEIAETEQKISEAEDKGLEHLEQIEGASAEIARLAHSVERLQEDWAEEKKRIAEREQARREALASLEQGRNQVTDQLDPAVATRYEKLNVGFPGTAVVPIDGTNCGGCHMNVVHHRIQEARETGKVVECNACRRFIYSVEEA